MEKKIIEKFGNRLRLRVSGILIAHDSILLVKHTALGEKGILWAPPGGGMKFGMSAEENLKREFMEETGLEIMITRFLFVHEFLEPPLHAVELFFEVRQTGGTLIRGIDPEMNANEQIIQLVSFISFKKFADMNDVYLHHAIRNCKTPDALLNRKGYVKFDSAG